MDTRLCKIWEKLEEEQDFEIAFRDSLAGRFEIFQVDRVRSARTTYREQPRSLI